jgi:hypothetical protein
MEQETSESTSPTIPLDDVKAVNFDAFLSVIYPPYVDPTRQQACINASAYT